MSIRDNFSNVRPTLLMSFTNSKTVDPRANVIRTSNATFRGLQQVKTDENLLVHSETLSNWRVGNTTIAVKSNDYFPANTSNTVWILTATANGSAVSHTLKSNNQFYVVNGYSYTLSFTAKANTYGNLQIVTEGTNYALGVGRANFNLVSGVVGTVDGGTSSIESLANSFYRCAYTVTANNSGLVNVHAGIITTSTAAAFEAFTTTGTEDIVIANAQAEQRSGVTEYVRTGSSPVTLFAQAVNQVRANVARIEYDANGECQGLLVEGAATNLQIRSQNFGTNWAPANTTASYIKANAAVGLDGTISAGLFACRDTATIARIFRPSSNYTSVANTIYTYSIYVKPKDWRYIALTLAEGTSVSVNVAASGVVDFETDTFTLKSTPLSPLHQSYGRVENVGGGWRRVSITGEAAHTNLRGKVTLLDSAADTAASTTVGVPDAGVYLWGAQAEVGVAPTSYIPTEGTTVTRSADNVEFSGVNFSAWYNQSEGTFLWEGTVQQTASANSANVYLFNFNDSADSANNKIVAVYRPGNVANAISIETTTTLGANTLLASDSAQTVIFVSEAGTVTTMRENESSPNKIIFSYKGNTGTLGYLAGTSNYTILLSQNTSYNIAANLNNFEFGFGPGFSSDANTRPQGAHIKKIAYYPKQMSNTQIQNLGQWEGA